MSIILDYLESHPEGATPQQIADHVDGNAESYARTLQRLEQRGQAKLINGGPTAVHGTWISTIPPTPPVFRAMETLAAMQAACRARLMGQLETV
jgi:hypothetical protein